MINQESLFEERQISFDDKNLFIQDNKKWNINKYDKHGKLKLEWLNGFEQ